MAVGQESTITRGFLFADLRGYTDFVEQRGAADPQAADGAGDWDLIRQQDFGPSTQL